MRSWCFGFSSLEEQKKHFFFQFAYTAATSHKKTRGCHFGQKVDLGGKNTFYSQSVLHHFLSISQFLDFSNLILNSYFEVTFVTCQDGWVVRALDSHARDPWFKSHWQQAFLLRKGFQKFFKKWLSPMWKWWDISSSSIMAISSLIIYIQCHKFNQSFLETNLNFQATFHSNFVFTYLTRCYVFYLYYTWG